MEKALQRMGEYLDKIRMPKVKAPLSSHVAYSALFLLLGIALGVLSKWLDNLSVNDAFVRHPMYFATVLLFWAMPLVLGSLPAFLVMLPYLFLLVKRIRNEEKVLREGLIGYTEYCGKVCYRPIPFVW